jgi:hypothetical protein
MSNASATDFRGPVTDASLVRQTLRTIAVLVGALVLFVGALSIIAVAVTSRAVGSGAKQADTQADPGAKKPLSI